VGPSAPIPDGLKAFVLNHVASVEQLEILCLFFQDVRRAWSARDIFREIQSSERSIDECLKHFERAGLIGCDHNGDWSVAAPENDLIRSAEGICKLYRERRVSVIELIYNPPVDNLQNFADAFKLRKDP
jgi:hypothetical protein